MTVEDLPVPSKYRVVDVPKAIPNIVDVVLADGVDRMSPITLERIAAAVVCPIAARWVCAPMGNNPNTTIRLNAATANATVTSTSEKPLEAHLSELIA